MHSNQTKENQLIHASREGQLETVRLLLDFKVAINSTNEFNETALTEAAYKGHLDIVCLLLDRKAEINSQDWFGNTALIGAINHEQFKIIHLLVEQGASIESPNYLGCTALEAAQSNPEVTRILKDQLQEQRSYPERKMHLRLSFLGDLEKKSIYLPTPLVDIIDSYVKPNGILFKK